MQWHNLPTVTQHAKIQISANIRSKIKTTQRWPPTATEDTHKHQRPEFKSAMDSKKVEDELSQLRSIVLCTDLHTCELLKSDTKKHAKAITESSRTVRSVDCALEIRSACCMSKHQACTSSAWRPSSLHFVSMRKDWHLHYVFDLDQNGVRGNTGFLVHGLTFLA